MGCSSSITAKTIQLSTLDLDSNQMKGYQRKRAKSTVSNVSTVLGIDKEKVKIPLSERETLSLMRSWEKVHEDIANNGMLMFIRMFETHPGVKSVFEKFGNVNDPSEMWQADVLKIHGMTVMAAIDDIICNMDDQETVIELMLEQGMSHSKFGDHMSEDTFWAIEEPFLKAVSESLGEKYSINIQHIYKRTIHFILETFVLGFHHAVKQDKLREKNKKKIEMSSYIEKSSTSVR